MSDRLTYVPRGHQGYECELQSPAGYVLRAARADMDVPPMVSGDSEPQANETLVENLLDYAGFEFMARRVKNAEKKKSYRDQADHHADFVLALSGWLDRVGSTEIEAWCSACLAKGTHRQVQGRHVPRVWICDECGSPTARCAAPRCKNRAVRRIGNARFPEYCAEHRHDIPGFEKLESRLASIEDYEQWLAYDRKDLAKVAKIGAVAGVTATVIAPAAFFAAPAIGGALGASWLGGSLTGAAATSHGLAMLGGGSIAAGGLGMAGGTAVVTVAGAGLGTGLGAAAASSYVSDDDSFGIVRLRSGRGTPVLVASGFTTEGDLRWAHWRRIIDQRYPDNPVYRVHWGAKELKAFGSLATLGASKGAAAVFAKSLAAKAAKQGAKKVPFLGVVWFGKDIVTNPWSTAKARSEMTGVALADIIARTETNAFVLVGHSLGARVMCTAATTLGTRESTPKLESVHLLGAAVSTGEEWRPLNDSVHEYVWNYWSKNDAVLRQVYRAVQAGKTAVGTQGFKTGHPKIKDRNVSNRVPSHSAYFAKVKLAGGD